MALLPFDESLLAAHLDGEQRAADEGNVLACGATRDVAPGARESRSARGSRASSCGLHEVVQGRGVWTMDIIIKSARTMRVVKYFQRCTLYKNMGSVR